MIWLNSAREKIKADNPGIAVTEIAKKGGEMWRELKDKSVRILLLLCIIYYDLNIIYFSFMLYIQGKPEILVQPDRG